MTDAAIQEVEVVDEQDEWTVGAGLFPQRRRDDRIERQRVQTAVDDLEREERDQGSERETARDAGRCRAAAGTSPTGGELEALVREPGLADTGGPLDEHASHRAVGQSFADLFELIPASHQGPAHQTGCSSGGNAWRHRGNGNAATGLAASSPRPSRLMNEHFLLTTQRRPASKLHAYARSVRRSS